MKGKRGKRRNITRLSVAAYHFTQGINTAKGLSEVMGMSEGHIYKWVKLPEWDKALDDLKFTGTRTLHSEPKRNLVRDAGDLAKQAETLYLQSRTDGNTPKQAVTFVCKALGIVDRRRVNRWRDRLGWEATHADATDSEV